MGNNETCKSQHPKGGWQWLLETWIRVVLNNKVKVMRRNAANSSDSSRTGAGICKVGNVKHQLLHCSILTAVCLLLEVKLAGAGWQRSENFRHPPVPGGCYQSYLRSVFIKRGRGGVDCFGLDELEGLFELKWLYDHRCFAPEIFWDTCYCIWQLQYTCTS